MGGRSIKQVIRNKKIFLLLMPFLVFFILIFVLGLIEIVKTSFGFFPFTENKFSLDFYKAIFSNPKFYQSLLYTIYLGMIPTIFSVGIGVFLAVSAFVANQRPNGFLLAKLPNIIPYTVYTFVVIILVMQTGLISRIAFNLKIIDNASAFPLFLYDDASIGVGIVYLLKQVPFVFLIVYASLHKVGKNHFNVAKNLGAGNFYTIKNIVLPTIKTSIMTVFIVCFAFNIGSFEVPYIIGSPKYETLPIMSYRYYTSANLEQRPLSMVINVFMLVMCIIIILWYLKFLNKENNYEKV